MPDRRTEFWGNENRARLSDSRNLPTDRSADSNVGAKHDANSVPGNDIFAPPVRGDAPMTLDPHANQRHSNNLANPPCEVQPRRPYGYHPWQNIWSRPDI
jgi:hypothetical protein